MERLGEQTGPGEITRPPRLMEAMRHAVLGGGKRLRPFLAIETAKMLGGAEAAALAAGAGVELVHCYSLVHDDLPAMDNDDMRRGKPTVHKAYDEATAILVGDALLTLAFEVVADPAWQPDPAIRADLVLGLARASGLGGMVGGQLLDLTAEGRFGAVNLDVDDTLRMQAMKTGAILAFSVEAGALVGGADKGQRAALLRYGHALGQAFQIADDILDREARPRRWARRPARTRTPARRPWWTASASTAPAPSATASWRSARMRCPNGARAPASCARRPLHRGAEDLRARFTPARRTASSSPSRS